MKLAGEWGDDDGCSEADDHQQANQTDQQGDRSGNRPTGPECSHQRAERHGQHHCCKQVDENVLERPEQDHCSAKGGEPNPLGKFHPSLSLSSALSPEFWE